MEAINTKCWWSHL